MKQLACMLLAALMLLTLFTGCSSSQTVETLPGLAPATGTEAQPKPEIDYEVPARFTGEWTGVEDTFTVKADAEILLPGDVSLLSTAKVTRHFFTQEEADKVLEVFLKGNPLYENIYATKESLQKQLEHYEAIQRGEIPYEHDGTIDDVPQVIERIKQNIETALHEGEKFLADAKFHPEVLAEGTVRYGESPIKEIIEGYGEADGRIMHCYMVNSTASGVQGEEITVWEDGYGDTMGPCLTQPLWELSPVSGNEQAEKVGNDLMKALGLEVYTCNQVTPVQYARQVLVEDNEKYTTYRNEPIGEEGYLLEYVRELNGLPLTKTNFAGTASEDNAPDIGSWVYERVQVYVLGDRVVYFQWMNPYEVTDIQPAGKLMDFQQIQEVFAKMIFVKNDYWRNINEKNGFPTFRDLNIDKVQLTLMRVRPKDSVTEGRIIPVWDFWGTETSKWDQGTGEMTGEPRYGVLLSINAIDGTLVDREIGY